MEIPIAYPLSNETHPEYKAALDKVQASKNRGGKVIDVKLEEIGPGQFTAVIVMNEEV